LSLFYFLSLSRISEKSENSHHAKIVNYNVFSELDRWFQSTTLSDHLSFFCLLGYSISWFTDKSSIELFVENDNL
jgi:hypothetical protein